MNEHVLRSLASIVVALALASACSSPEGSAVEGGAPEPAAEAPGPARSEVDARGYLAVVVAPGDIGLYWQDEDGAPYGQLQRLRQKLEEDGRRVRLLANAGIYLPGQIPAGLHIENGVELRPLNLADGEGNFQLLPNGVFSIVDGPTGAIAGVLESNRFAAAGLKPSLAVQSGPQLLLDGAIHPAFSETSTSTFVRNGVGVTADGDVLFLMATTPVTLWAFATEFLDRGVANALYLDGAISAMGQPMAGERLSRNVPFAAILAVTASSSGP